MQVIELHSVSQDEICLVEDGLRTGEFGPVIDIECEHLFADSAYARTVFLPAGTWAVGKPHRTNHFCVLLEGELQVIGESGIPKTLIGPRIFVSSPGKKMVHAITNVRFANIHPTELTDIEAIENEVIMPETEYRAALSTNKQELLEV